MTSTRRVAAIFITAQFVFSACADLENGASPIETSTTSGTIVPSDTPTLEPSTPPADSSTSNSTTNSRPPKNSSSSDDDGEDLAPSKTVDPPSPAPESTVPAKGEVSDNSFAATEVFAQLTVTNEVGTGYDRDLFRHWIDSDGNDCDTRQEVLIRDSRSLVQIDPYRCKVIAGNWYSPYDGAVWENPSDVDIDHVVALKEAWDSGAWQWSSERRRAFANDLSDSRSLMAVTDSVNQSKGDRDPSQWMPPRRDYRCSYISMWLAVKARWSLAVDPSEAGMIRSLLEEECRGLRVAKWAPAPIA